LLGVLNAGLGGAFFLLLVRIAGLSGRSLSASFATSFLLCFPFTKTCFLPVADLHLESANLSP
jgi:hypothetical protein